MLKRAEFLFRCNGQEAYRNLSGNRFGVWSKRSWYEGPDKITPNDVPKRLLNEVFIPGCKGKFKLNREDGVFAVGSCFARIIEDAIEHSGDHVLSRPGTMFDDQLFMMHNPHVRPVEFVNRYNTGSMLLEFKRLLDPEFMLPDSALIYTYPDGTTHDLHYYDLWSSSPGPDEALKRRHIIKDRFSSIKNARVIVLTLGLVEAWFDIKAELYLNMTPSSELVDTQGNDLELHLLGYEENLTNLVLIYNLLKRYGNPDIKIIVTVSPVPLAATFTTDDIVIANTRSKSILRAVADEFSRMFTDVDYYPSYEVVLNTGLLNAFLGDGRHVKNEVSKRIIKLFQETYYGC